MLKFFFWSLLAVNAALYAYGRGYLGHFSGNEREPARMQHQLNANKLFLITPAKAIAATQPAPVPAPAPPAPVAKKVENIACLEIGNFLLTEARKFETQLAKLDLGDRQARLNMPGTEVSSYIVYLPPQGGKEGADKKAAELRQLGVTNYFIMSDNPTMRWGVSLGVFKSETAAQNLLASLQKQGVHGARLAPRMGGSKQLAFQFRDISVEVKAQLEKLRGGFEGKNSRSCK